MSERRSEIPVCEICKAFASPLTTFAEMSERMRHTSMIKSKLKRVAALNWMTVYMCKLCGTHWTAGRPYAEQPGGGPEVFYQIHTEDPKLWLESATDATHLIRARHEMGDLLDEVGPQTCTSEGCSRLRIRLSTHCAEHHLSQHE